MAQLNQRLIIHLTTTIKNIRYVIGTLRFQKKKEFSYFFLDSRSSVNNVLDCDSKKMVSPLEHITWHSDSVHIKRKDNSVVDKYLYEDIPLCFDTPIITPLYVESIYFENNSCLTPSSDFTAWKGSKCQEVLVLDSSKGFSMIFILVPALDSTESILLGFQFKNNPQDSSRICRLADLVDINHRAGRINLWEGWDMLVIVSPFLCTLLSPVHIQLNQSLRLINYKRVQSALTDLMNQANRLISKEL